MQKPQWVTVGIAFLLLIILYSATSKGLFGERKAKTHTEDEHAHTTELTTDSILFYARKNLTPEQMERLNMLENSISRGDVATQKLRVYHQLSHFWKDSARIFAPYAFYLGEAARLENSENSLTFAAHLFLDNLTTEGDPRWKQWVALQAKDLFERSLKLNPDNDSSKVGLGAVYLYGGISQPMEGVGKIRDVVGKDSTNVYAQMTLAKASLFSGQLDKAIDRLQIVARLQPQNVEAILLIADTYERMKNKEAAIEWYKKSIPFVANPEYKKEVEKRISELKK